MRNGVVRSLTRVAVVSAFIPFAMSATSPALAQSVDTMRDEFRSVSYGGNEGSATFNGPWIERGETDGPSSGALRVVASDRCAGGTGSCLYLGLEGGSIDPYTIDRAVDIDDAIEATLTFRWRRHSQGQVGGAVRVRVSGDGGSSWTTLTTINFAGSQGPASESFDITSWAGSSTVIRFDGTGSDADGFLAVDDVQIAATITETTTTRPASTTTTTPGSTTTVPGTTTTVPGATTTTTLPDSTTTIPGVNPTTTLAGSTTTVPGVTSTTEPASGTTTTTVASASTSSVPTEGDSSPATSTAPTTNDIAATTVGDTTSAGDDEQGTTTTGPDATSAADGATEETSNAAFGVAPSEPSDGPPLVLVAAQILILGALVAAAATIGVTGGNPTVARATRSPTGDR